MRALSNKELQGIIRTIDASPQREQLLQQYIASNSDFAQFVHSLTKEIATDLHTPAEGAGSL